MTFGLGFCSVPVLAHFYPRDVYVSAVFATATWLAGCLSVKRRYCVKTAKPILKLFRSSDSAIVLVFDPSRRCRTPRKPLQWGL